MTNYHRLGGSNNKYLFLTVLEAGKSEIKVLADSMSGESPLLVHRWLSFCCVLTWKKGLRISQGSLL